MWYGRYLLLRKCLILLNEERKVMDNKYIDAFLECVTWKFKKSDVIRISETDKSLSQAFKEIFPKLSLLLSNSIAFEITLRDKLKYQLLCWENKNIIGGWLCQTCEKPDIEMLHLNMLRNELGTIVESWGFEDKREDIICNMKGVLFDDIQYGIGEIKDIYIESCNYENLLPSIEDKDYIVIAEEANGNMTLCNKFNEKVILFAADHCFDYVTVYDGCPEYTFYRINQVENIVDYFELLAQQWLEYLE